MPKTAVGLFENPGVVEVAIHEIEGLGFPRNEIRAVNEPVNFEVTGVMSFARLDFETDLIRELTRIGMTEAEAKHYVAGLERGGALVFATGSDERVDAAANIMSQCGAVAIEEASGPEPQSPGEVRVSMAPISDSSAQSRRARQSYGGASLFTW